jgi:hypothetical protein
VSNVIRIDRGLVLRCHCGNDLWYIPVDAVVVEKFAGFVCSRCEEFIELEMVVKEDGG